MKKFTLLFITSAITTLSFAQEIKESSVPKAVKDSFQKKYANVKDVKWDKENKEYEASFTVNDVKNSVLLDATGNIKETEVEIPQNELPKAATEYVKTKYPKEKIASSAKITDAKGTIKYEAEVKGKDLFFDANGKFLK